MTNALKRLESKVNLNIPQQISRFFMRDDLPDSALEQYDLFCSLLGEESDTSLELFMLYQNIATAQDWIANHKKQHSRNLSKLQDPAFEEEHDELSRHNRVLERHADTLMSSVNKTLLKLQELKTPKKHEHTHTRGLSPSDMRDFIDVTPNDDNEV